MVKVKRSRYRPGVAQRVDRGIALLFHYRSTRRGWVVSSTSQPHFTPGKDPVSILQEAGWAPGPVCTGGKSRPQRDLIPNGPARGQSLYRLSYRAHRYTVYSFSSSSSFKCRSQLPRGLRRRSAAARLLRSWVRTPPGHGCLLSVLCVTR